MPGDAAKKIELHGFDGADTFQFLTLLGTAGQMRGGPGSDKVYGAGSWQIGPGQNMGSATGGMLMSFDTTENLSTLFSGPRRPVAVGRRAQRHASTAATKAARSTTPRIPSPVRANLGSRP
jgi:hypothetical protein